jgi:hypothetical protein
VLERPGVGHQLHDVADPVPVEPRRRRRDLGLGHAHRLGVLRMEQW